MMGDGGRALRVGALLEAPLERPPEPQVQLGPLAGKEVGLDHLAQEGMAELVGAVVLHGQDVRVDGLAQRVAQGRPVEVARVVEHRMIEPLPDGEQPQQPSGGLGQPLDAQHQRVTQRVRRGPAGREQLLAEQRVAAGARPQALQQVVGRGGAEDVGSSVSSSRARGRRATRRAPSSASSVRRGWPRRNSSNR